VALYEICARYRDNPSGLTSRKPVQWWSDALSPAPAGSERREWRKIKSERVKDAIDDINRETDLEIELIEHKEGRAVVEAQFAVRRKRPSSRPRWPQALPIDAHLVLRAESLGVRETKLEGLIAEFGEDQVRSRVEQLERRAASPQLRGVDNGYAYLRALLRHGEPEAEPGAGEAAAAAATAETRPAAPGEPGQPTAAPAASADSPNWQALRQAQDDWLAERIAQVKGELAALDPVQRQPWVELALAELASKQLLSAVVSRRAAQGDVLHGLLGSVIVRLYAQAVHGAGWDKPATAAEPRMPAT
jgi:hypothetical protein